MNDREIIGAVLGGQTRRFEVLVDRYLGMIRGLCASYVAQPSPCEDLVQETFIDGYTQLGRLRQPERFPAWLARIARNKCISWIRRESRRKEVHEQIQREPLPLGDDILSSLTRQELRDYVRSSMKKLPAKTREAMMLCYLEGLSGQEIAAALDISESAVKKRLQYGREILSSSLWNVVHDTQDTEDDKDKLKKQVMAAVPFGTAPLKAGLFSTAVGKILTAKAMSIAAPVAMIAVAASWPLMNLTARPETSNETETAVALFSDEMSSESDGQESAVETDKDRLARAANQSGGDGLVHIQVVHDTPEARETKNYPPVPYARVLIVPRLVDEQKLRLHCKEAGISESDTQLILDFLSINYSRIGPSIYSLSPSEYVQDRFDALTAFFIQRQQNVDHRTYVLDAPRDSWIDATADENGHLDINLQPNAYCFVARTPDDPRPWPRKTTDSPDRTTILRISDDRDWNFKLNAQEYKPKTHIHGNVVMAGTNEPVFKAKVDLTCDFINRTFHATTNEEGFFEFNSSKIRNGKYTLSVDDENYFMKKNYEGVYSDDNSFESIQIEVNKRGIITGTVKQPDGTPVPELFIMVRLPDGSARGGVKTDEHGRYSVGHDGGEISLYASGSFSKSEEVTFDLRADESIEQDLLFPHTTRLMFRLTMPDGKVVEELKIMSIAVEMKNGNSHSSNDNKLQKEGEWFVLSHASPGTYNCVFGTEENAIAIIEGIRVSAKDREKRINVVMEQGAETLSILVLDYEGVPIAGQYVSISMILEFRAEIFIENSKTDAQGRCVFQQFPSEEFRIDTSIKEEYLWKKITLPHTGDVVLQAQQKREVPRKVSVELNVTVPAEENRPLDNDQAVWFLINRDTGEKNRQRRSVTPGDYLLVYARPGYTSAIREITVPDDPDRMRIIIDLPLGESGALYGEILNVSDDEKEQVSLYRNYRIEVFPESLMPLIQDKSIDTNYENIGVALAQSAKADDDGYFYVSNLPPGNYFVGVDMQNLTGPWEVLANHETGPVTVKPR